MKMLSTLLADDLVLQIAVMNEQCRCTYYHVGRVLCRQRKVPASICKQQPWCLCCIGDTRQTKGYGFICNIAHSQCTSHKQSRHASHKIKQEGSWALKRQCKSLGTLCCCKLSLHVSICTCTYMHVCRCNECLHVTTKMCIKAVPTA